MPAILDAVFEPTLNMINQDFAEFPEHRVGFFKLLRAINLNCFPGARMAPPRSKPERSHANNTCSLVDHSAAAVQIVHGQYHLGYQAHDA